MDGRSIFTLAEAAAKAGLAQDLLEVWIRDKIVQPSLMADHADPMFDERDLLQLAQLRQLSDIGYSTAEIRKIAKKIGLPQPKRPHRKGPRVEHYLTVGELANQTGLNPRTIKYWEERGIIEPSTRSDGGFRLYEEYYTVICHLIHDLQLFGYSLEQIKTFADLFRNFHTMNRNDHSGTREEEVEVVEAMLSAIDNLFARMDELSKGIDRWHKLLKEKKTECSAWQRRLSKEPAKSATAANLPVKNPS